MIHTPFYILLCPGDDTKHSSCVSLAFDCEVLIYYESDKCLFNLLGLFTELYQSLKLEQLPWNQQSIDWFQRGQIFRIPLALDIEIV